MRKNKKCEGLNCKDKAQVTTHIGDFCLNCQKKVSRNIDLLFLGTDPRTMKPLGES